MAAQKIDIALLNRIQAVAGEVLNSPPDGDDGESGEPVIKSSIQERSKTERLVFFQNGDMKTLVMVKVVFNFDNLKANLEIYEGGKNISRPEDRAYEVTYDFTDGDTFLPFLFQLNLFLGKNLTDMK